MGTFNKMEQEMMDELMLLSDKDEMTDAEIKQLMENVIESWGFLPDSYSDYIDDLVAASFNMEPVKYG